MIYSLKQLYYFLIQYSSNIPKEVYLFASCVILHYISPYVYIELCVPDTIQGFLMSPFMVMTPHCQIIRWCGYYSGCILNNLWLLLAAWMLRLLITYSNIDIM